MLVTPQLERVRRSRRNAWVCPRWTILVAMAICVSCESRAQVKRYQVPTEATPTTAVEASPTVSQRMLAAIVPTESQAWFFKVMGPSGPISEITAPFRSLLASVRFADPDNPPTWTLPQGWQQQPGNQFRFAALVAEGLEVTVSSLPVPNGGASAEYFCRTSIGRAISSNWRRLSWLS